MKGACGGDASSYWRATRATGKRLFANKSPEHIELEKQMLEDWMAELPAEDRKDVEKMIERKKEKEIDEETPLDPEFLKKYGHRILGYVEPDVQKIREERAKPWWAKEGEDPDAWEEDFKDSDYVMSRVWKEYKEFLKESQDEPMMGAQCWEIDDWPAEVKKKFAFSSMD